MGMFDTVVFRCPRCDQPIEEQTKAGECCLHHHPSDNVPPEIAKSLLGDTVHCSGCNHSWTVVAQPIPNVRLSLVPKESY